MGKVPISKFQSISSSGFEVRKVGDFHIFFGFAPIFGCGQRTGKNHCRVTVFDDFKGRLAGANNHRDFLSFWQEAYLIEAYVTGSGLGKAFQEIK